MHRNVKLDIANVTKAHEDAEDRIKWVLHVWTNLSSDDKVAMRVLKNELDKFISSERRYTSYVVYPKDGSNA